MSLCFVCARLHTSLLLCIGQVRRTDQILDFLPAHSPATCLDHCHTYSGSKENCNPVHKEDGSCGGKKDEPEPQEDVDLFIDNVQRQNTESIVLLNCARDTVLAESTLRHLGKNHCHGICALLGVKFSVVEHIE